MKLTSKIDSSPPFKLTTNFTYDRPCLVERHPTLNEKVKAMTKAM